MTSHAIQRALDQLLTAATDVDAGLIPTVWQTPTGQLVMRREHYHFHEVGLFDDIEVGAGEGLRLYTRIQIPEQIQGAQVAGDPLQLFLFSLRPIDVIVDGVRIFGDDLPIVASGPALITLVPELVPGAEHEIVLDILPSEVRLDPGFLLALNIRLNTPSVRDRFEVLDLAHARLLLADALATTGPQRQSVEEAATMVPAGLEALTTDELRLALGDVDNLRGLTAGFDWVDDALVDYHMHCVGHSHIDLAWLHTWADAKEVFYRDMRTVLALADEFPEFRFTHSQAVGYSETQREHPELFARVRDLVAEGRLEPATVQWVEPDPNLPSGPSHARQLLEAVRYTRSELGVTPKVLLAPDAFGHAGNLPQLGRSAGAEVYYQHRANPGYEVDGRPWQAWEWEGDDGTRLLGVATPVYLGPITASRLARDLLLLGQANGVGEVCFFYGVGDHGGGPAREDLLAIRSLGRAKAFPAVRCATLLDYVAALRESGVKLPVFRGETDRVFEGCYTTHGDAKRLNREAERELVAAETLAAQVGMQAAMPLHDAWQGVLLRQFHDTICGSAVGEAYVDQAKDVSAALAIADDVSKAARAILAAGRTEGELLVTNTRLAAWQGPIVLPVVGTESAAVHVEDEFGEKYPAVIVDGGALFVGALEPGESRSFSVVPGEVAGTLLRLDPDAIEIDTRHLTLRVDPGSGIITGCKDKSRGVWVTGREGLSPESERQRRPDLGLGVVNLYHERPHYMSSWVSDFYEAERLLISGADVVVRDESPVRVVVEATHRFDSSEVRVQVSVYADLPWFEVQAVTKWGEAGNADTGIDGIALSFGTLQQVDRMWAETPFAAVARATDGYLSAAQRWVDLEGPQGGLAVANDSKHGVDVLGPKLRYHLVRGAYDPDPISDLGRTDIARFAVLPHAGTWREARVVNWAAAFNQPPVVTTVAAGGEAPVTPLIPRVVVGDGAQIAGMYPGDDGAPVLRVYEAHGIRSRVTIAGLDAVSSVQELRLSGDPLGPPRPVVEGAVTLEFAPFEVRSLALNVER